MESRIKIAVMNKAARQNGNAIVHGHCVKIQDFTVKKSVRMPGQPFAPDGFYPVLAVAPLAFRVFIFKPPQLEISNVDYFSRICHRDSPCVASYYINAQIVKSIQ